MKSTDQRWALLAPIQLLMYSIIPGIPAAVGTVYLLLSGRTAISKPLAGFVSVVLVVALTFGARFVFRVPRVIQIRGSKIILKGFVPFGAETINSPVVDLVKEGQGTKIEIRGGRRVWMFHDFWVASGSTDVAQRLQQMSTS